MHAPISPIQELKESKNLAIYLQKLKLKNLIPPLKLKQDFQGQAPGIFVGRHNYPNINIGPVGFLGEQTFAQKQEIEPTILWQQEYQDIVQHRLFFMITRKQTNIKTRENDEIKYLAQAKNLPQVQTSFIKRPYLPDKSISFGTELNLYGPSAKLKNFKIIENPKIPAKVEKIINDELKAQQQLKLLYESGFSEYYLQEILSSGSFGQKQNQKLVPTRWSITATDDIITKNLLKNIRTYKELETFEIFEAKKFGNHFVILLMPGKFQYENFEAWSSEGPWWQNQPEQDFVSEENESYFGRTTYADKQGGGYYAARIAAVEYLQKIKRQAKVFSIREISSDYIIPMGVWVVRETAKQALQNKITFQTLKEALYYIQQNTTIKLQRYLPKSIYFQQTKITDF